MGLIGSGVTATAGASPSGVPEATGAVVVAGVLGLVVVLAEGGAAVGVDLLSAGLLGCSEALFTAVAAGDKAIGD